ncbi:hypothetical protein D3C77_399450 [compost metagenome]
MVFKRVGLVLEVVSPTNVVLHRPLPEDVTCQQVLGEGLACQLERVEPRRHSVEVEWPALFG